MSYDGDGSGSGRGRGSGRGNGNGNEVYTKLMGKGVEEQVRMRSE